MKFLKGRSLVLGIVLAGHPAQPLEAKNTSGLFAGQEVGVIAGTVLDTLGHKVSQAAVTVLPIDRTARTDKAGHFQIDSVPVGTFSLRVRRVGYLTRTLDSLVVKSGETTHVNVALTIPESDKCVVGWCGQVTEVPWEHFLNINGARLQIVDWGHDGPLMVLLPGFGAGAHIFDDLAPAFNHRYHVVAITPRGFPPSDAPDSGYTIAQLATDVRTLLDSLHTRQAILVGHSIAGAVITRFAELFPNRLRAAIYLDAAFDFGPTYRMSHARPFGPPDLSDTNRVVRAWRHRYAVDSTAQKHNDAMWNIDSADAVHRQALVHPLVDEVRTHPHEVWHVQAPALAICSADSFDRVYGWLAPDSTRWQAAKIYIDSVALPFQRQVCTDFQQHLPHGKGVSLDSGHMVFIDRRKDVIKIMTGFLRSLRDKGA